MVKISRDYDEFKKTYYPKDVIKEEMEGMTPEDFGRHAARNFFKTLEKK